MNFSMKSIDLRKNSKANPSRARRIGRAFGLDLKKSNSGSTNLTACMSAFSTNVHLRAGPPNSSIRKSNIPPHSPLDFRWIPPSPKGGDTPLQKPLYKYQGYT